jgi:hypothetical protein
MVLETTGRFLDEIWGTRQGYAELRVMGPNGISQSFAQWPGSRDRLLKEVSEYDPTKVNIFFGVLLRTREGGKAEDCEPEVNWLWADVDKKKGATFADLLRAQAPSPNIIVDSGHGWHLYWRLAKPMTHDTAQRTMEAVAQVYGGDHVGDPARIMRLPGSLNVKSDPALPVRLVRFMDLTFTWRTGDFPQATSSRAMSLGTGTPTGSQGTRSEDLWHIALDGAKQGWEDDRILEEMLAVPAGSKIAEMREEQATRWVQRTILKARTSLLSKS